MDHFHLIVNKDTVLNYFNAFLKGFVFYFGCVAEVCITIQLANVTTQCFIIAL